jgi:hypothetical protein
MTSWTALDDELAHWRDAGRIATFWWRDDDAVRATDALSRLLALARRWEVPLALAVIPGHAEPSVAEILAARPEIAVLQHGFRHVNHAGEGEKKSELGAQRPLRRITDELGAGRRLIEDLFGSAALPVLAPPWNRIDGAVVTALAGLGIAGISCFGARRETEAAPGVARVNTHVDIIDWRGGRGYRGDHAVLGDLCDHLAARRLGAADATEPTGLLTHHLDHDEACWEFIETLLERTRRNSPAGSLPDHHAGWQSAAQLFMPRAGLQ